MMHATEFLLDQGLYALAGLGAFFVVVEARAVPAQAGVRPGCERRGLVLALALAALFWLDPPLLPRTPPAADRRAAMRSWPAPEFDWARVAIYYALALLAVRRFAGRFDVGFWLVAAASCSR
jgi:hypothetical protein